MFGVEILEGFQLLVKLTGNLVRGTQRMEMVGYYRDNL